MSTTITRSIDATSIVPDLVLAGWSSEQEAGTIVHDIVGRPDDPDITLRGAGPRRGTIKLLFMDAARAELARAFHSVGAVFTATSSLTWVPASYVVADGRLRVTQTSENRLRWTVEVPYVEVLP